ncbi:MULTISPECIES: carboxylesterase/lipase family protein [unclassified Mycolicibacterium]|uniref:carboxylesterase/lipase family protein n=1 Tax=unclassified Mycolicibacterium TaxID=2636767 RepID=UPI0012DF13AC|nr:MULTISPECIES: carboxylesterase family protein [unclassified Mycolicibacterium]MUL82106.1 carboxylesterase/lipase family protein [Mycolicibacterium sp. CBMA 329]MUL87872.1 carboxylesterase/lipase family protein [Mycolicibacterium sp. CBMA 331]MUM01695.1 carboxylesterase/lipase family protein [Mycolicibacterium sp. CBMA 334]MUM38169.1 carboxylesterase/lipase family protein [Mycolicibacterium sp. CBMA 247]MUM43937.1 carboxylesterase/lipase family protein [Mycolicibacterium sp. CBMA 294]
MPEPIVDTTGGAVRGVATPGAWTFLGIPYAAPPTVAGRFAAPEAHEPWPDVRDATRLAPTAPQPRRNGFGRLDMSPFFGPGWVRDPDYLTVNVWTPPNARGRPVMVFVHGGGFVAGSTRSPLYDGTAFARDGVVLVTVTYRLGITGFLDLLGAVANRGLLDVLAALGWVQANIEAFGGDPGNVTLFGQSAGATITAGALSTPGVQRLIRRAIMQSGNGFGAFSPEQAERVTRAAAEALNVEPTVAGFDRVSDEQLVEVIPKLAGLDLRTEGRFDPLLGLSPFSLVLAEQPALQLNPEVGLLIGTNTEEGNLYLVPQGHFDASTRDDVDRLAVQVDTDPAALVQRYRSRFPRAGWGELRSAILGDALFRTGSDRTARAHAELAGAATHRYEFSWCSMAVDGTLRAAHAVELPFVFDRTGLESLRGPGALLGPGEPPATLAAEMHGAWVRYATTGDPGWAPSVAGRFTGSG